MGSDVAIGTGPLRRDEIRAWRRATPEERDRALWSACRAAAQTLATREDRERVLAYRDLPSEESRRHLERLQATCPYVAGSESPTNTEG